MTSQKRKKPGRVFSALAELENQYFPDLKKERESKLESIAPALAQRFIDAMKAELGSKKEAVTRKRRTKNQAISNK